jgi:hypothetical protein
MDEAQKKAAAASGVKGRTMAEFRRFGRFTAPAQWAHEFRTDLKRVMGQCIVFRAEHLFHSNQIEYWAASEHFRPVSFGEVVPEYRWIIEADGPLRAEEVAPRGVPAASAADLELEAELLYSECKARADAGPGAPWLGWLALHEDERQRWRDRARRADGAGEVPRG